VKDYRYHASPAQDQHGKSRDSLGCTKKGETAEHQARQDLVRQASDGQTQSDVPSSRVLSDETNLPRSHLRRLRNALVPAHSVRSHFTCQVCVCVGWLLQFPVRFFAAGHICLVMLKLVPLMSCMRMVREMTHRVPVSSV